MTLDAKLSEREAGHAERLLRFGFAKGKKESILFRGAASKQPVERASDFHMRSSTYPFAQPAIPTGRWP